MMILGLCFLAIITVAQPKLSTTSKKAIKKFEKAIEYFNVQKDDNALKELQNAVKADPTFIEAYLLMSDIFHEKSETENELNALKKAININPGYSPKTAFYLGESAFKLGRYETSRQAFEAFMDYGTSKKMLKRADFLIKCCDFAIEAMANPVPFEPINLGQEVNSPYNDMAPSLTVDEETLIITVDIPKDSNRPYSPDNRQEDFFISRKKDGQWTKTVNMGPPVNTTGNEGMQSISADGKVLVYASSSLPNGFGSTDLYISHMTNSGWSQPLNMGKPVNSEKWDTQPSLSSDGKSMYFVSTRKGSLGLQDIWFTKQDNEGKWSEPINLGENVNTEGYESSPFIHPDGKTLYFTSGNRIGMGGYDIYKTNRISEGKFSEPINLGYPINTHLNDEFLIVNAGGDFAFISSKRPGSAQLDIYTFEIPMEIRPNPVSYMKGKIFNAETNEPVKANFELVNLSSSEIEIRSESNNEDGQYLVCLPTGDNYAFDASADGYLFHSLNFSLKDVKDKTEPYILDIPLWPIKPGKSVVLNNIFFDTDKYHLKEESHIELNKLFRFLEKNPGVRIEIGGHTDNVGKADYNQRLSENRAKAVFSFLITMKVSPERISYKGYGLTKPIDTNDTKEGRANNRRTEFTIVE